MSQGALRKVLGLLSEAERRDLYQLLPWIMLTAVLETAGVASVGPFLGLLADENAIDRHEALRFLFRWMGSPDETSFFIAVGTWVLFMFVLSNTAGALSTYLLVTFSTMRTSELSVRLLRSYLGQPYEFFLGKNSAELGKNILVECTAVVGGVLGQSLSLVARAVVIATVVATLILLDPWMALGVIVFFGGVYGAIYLALRRSATTKGRERVLLNEARFKIAQEALGGVKELRLYGLENVAVRAFESVSIRFSKLAARNAVSVQLPRFAVETIALGGVLVIVLIRLENGDPLAGFLPVIGLYAVASYRLLPSLQVTFAAMNAIRFNLATLDVLVTELVDRAATEIRRKAETTAQEARSLVLDGVSYAYPGAQKAVLSDVSIQIGEGEWVALVGPTGAGKSTAVDILMGVLCPHAGQLLVNGQPKEGESPVAGVAYVPQAIFIIDDTVTRNVAFGLADEDIDHERVRWACKVAQIGEFIEVHLADGYLTRLGERGIRLSGGQRQRIGIARAVYRRPGVLVLDEATSALDGETEQRFFSGLRTELLGTSVVSIAHRLSTTKYFDRIVVLEDGRVVDEGTYLEVSKRSRHFLLGGKSV